MTSMPVTSAILSTSVFLDAAYAIALASTTDELLRRMCLRHKVPSDQFDELAGSEWFRNRVVDMSLFHAAN